MSLTKTFGCVVKFSFALFVALIFIFLGAAKTHASSGGALLNPDTQGEQKVAVLMVNFQNTTQPALTKATVDDLVFNQMAHFYDENSYGRTTISGDSYGWYNLPINQTCDTSAVLQASIQAADANVNFANYSRIIIFAPFSVNPCNWAGISSIGKTLISTGDGTLNMSDSIINTSYAAVDIATITHEFGHQLGLQHAQAIECGTTILTQDQRGCTSLEYGDPFDVMGYGMGHMNALHKDFLGWFDNTQIQNVVSDGTYVIHPLENSVDDLKAIKIQRSATDYLSVEYRQPIGADAGLVNIPSGTDVFAGAILHISGQGTRTMLLDGTPSLDARYASLHVGQIFTDPDTQTTVTVVSADATALTVNVHVGNLDFNYPNVSITRPLPNTMGTVFSGLMPISADASSAAGIQRVDFYTFGSVVPFASATTAPYSVVFDTTTVPDGYVSILAKAVGTNGLTQTAGVLFMVANSAPDLNSPTVSVVSPTFGSNVLNPVSLVASASDNVGVNSVSFYKDNELNPFATLFAPPYVASVSLLAGSHTVYAVARDAANNTGTSNTIGFTVTIPPPPDQTPPITNVTSPYAGQSVQGNVPVSVYAHDDVLLQTLKLYVDGQLYMTWPTPWTVGYLGIFTTSWNATGLAALSVHTLYTVASDSSGNVATSPTIMVTIVDTTAPTTSITSPIAGTSIASPATISATASDNVGVTKVDLFIDGTLVASPTTAPYTYGASLAPGSHTTYAKAYDAAGNTTTSASVSFTVTDTTAPSTSITSPTAGSLVASPATISALASDNVGITKVEFYTDGVLSAVSTTSPYATSVSLTSGSHSVFSKAYDAAGNTTTSSTVTFTVKDTTAPSTAVTAPIAGSSIASPVGIAASASDDVGVSKVEFYVDGLLASVSTTSPYAISVSLAPNSHTVFTKAYDAAGNVGTSSTVSFIITDTTTPITSITTPTAGTSIASPTTITASASDNIGVTKVEFYLDNTLTATSLTAPYAASVGLTVGSHTVYTKAYDAAGNVGTSSSISFTVADTTAPATSITSPIPNSSITSPVGIAASASDDVGVSKVEFYVDGTLLSSSTTSPYSTSASLAPGSHSVFTKAYDVAGNVGISSNISFTVKDTSAPTTSITTPTAGSLIVSPATISASASDNVGVTKVEFYLDNALNSTLFNAPYIVSAGLSPGSHVIYTKAYDAAGNMGVSSTVTFTVTDTTAPTVSITSPTSGASLPSPATISASASDNVGVTKVDLFVDGTLVASPTTAPYTYAASLAPGSHTTYAKAYDAARNTTTSSTVTFTVTDTTAPTITITSPTNNSLVSRNTTVTIQASASDNVAVTKVEFYINGTLKSTDTTVAYSYVWPVPVTKGVVYTLTAKAYDAAGNVKTSTTVTVTSK